MIAPPLHSPSDLARTGSSVAIRPGNCATPRSASDAATWLNKTAPSPKYQDDSRREDGAATFTGGPGAIAKTCPGPGKLTVPLVGFVGSNPPACTSISHFPEALVPVCWANAAVDPQPRQNASDRTTLARADMTSPFGPHDSV